MLNETESGKQDQTRMLIEVAPEHTLQREVDNTSDHLMSSWYTSENTTTRIF